MYTAEKRRKATFHFLSLIFMFLNKEFNRGSACYSVCNTGRPRRRKELMERTRKNKNTEKTETNDLKLI